MDKDNEFYEVETYSFCGFEKDEPWSDWEKGAFVVLALVTVPLWIIPFLCYVIVSELGRPFKDKKVIRRRRRNTYY